jgi:uncharacterized membrane protein
MNLCDRIAAFVMVVGIPNKVWGIFVFTAMPKMSVGTSLVFDEIPSPDKVSRRVKLMSLTDITDVGCCLLFSSVTSRT